jgi:transketolase
MRNAFAAALQTVADADERVVLLSGDIGNRLFDRFKASHTARFYNCGVAEANMIGVAAGLALAGFRPVTYTIASFSTYRCFEQIRVDVCYHHLPVIIVGTGAGLSYASNGGTHHACEDIAAMRALPGMTVLCPGDPAEVGPLLQAAVAHGGPVYLRLGKKGEPLVHSSTPALEIGKGHVMREGLDVCLLSTGTLLATAMETASLLDARGVSTRVVSMHTVKPLDAALLEDAAVRFPLVVTLEEHSVIGGLGGSVAEWLADRPARPRLLRIGTGDEFMHEAGGQSHARAYFHLRPADVAARIHDAR